MLYVTSLFPIIVYLIILKLLDGFKMVRWGMLCACLAAGMVACALAAAIAWNMDLGPWVPLIEEVLKGVFAVMLILRKRIVFFAEALVYGAAIGGGFALLENSIYLQSFTDMMFGTAMFRGCATALLHIGCTALVATLCLLTKNINETVKHTHSISSNAIISSVCLIIPIAIHYIYNMHLLPMMIQMFITVVLFLVIFIAINTYNENRIYKWLDHSISYDIQLLAAIRQGKLTETHTGQYLISIRSQFDAEVFFDIVCFMQLYLELVISGKSRMLLEQEGLAMPMTDEEKQTQREKVTELHTLRRNIGRMGEHILRPIIAIKDSDLRVIKKA